MDRSEPTAIVVDDTSQPFVGRWNRLVSTTNWEKGRIILDWRNALIAAGSPASEYSDECWSQKVGGITGQHAGRLRRVSERFGSTSDQFGGLYWSHFQTALDWDDAEMWLEGALQNDWSVSQMRRQRWETLGAPAELKPRDEDIIVGEVDEDFEVAADSASPDAIAGSVQQVQEPSSPAGPDFGDEDEVPASRGHNREDGTAMAAEGGQNGSENLVRPFENLAELPADLSEAFETFKLAILRHKAEAWQQVSLEDVLASLDALKELAKAPSIENAPL